MVFFKTILSLGIPLHLRNKESKETTQHNLVLKNAIFFLSNFTVALMTCFVDWHLIIQL